ncbi:MAG: hypothetical protein ACTSWK_04220 [Promethearchaeota archaeon]
MKFGSKDHKGSEDGCAKVRGTKKRHRIVNNHVKIRIFIGVVHLRFSSIPTRLMQIMP